MTLSDFERHVKCQTFLEDLCNYAPIVWPRATKFDLALSGVVSEISLIVEKCRDLEIAWEVTQGYPVFEIFDYSDLETGVMGHSRSSEPKRIYSPSMISYDVSQYTWVYLVPFPKYTEISVENRKIFRPLLFCVPAEEVPLGIGYGFSWLALVLGYRRCESENKNDGATRPSKKFEDIFSRLDTMHERDRQTVWYTRV